MQRVAWLLGCVLVLQTGSVALGQERTEPQLSVAAAQRDEARVHFQMGVGFYRDHDFRAALIEFRRAYEIAPHHTVLFNLAQTALELKEYVMALDYLARYLEQAGDNISPTRHDDVQSMMADLISRTALVQVVANDVANGAELRLDNEPAGTLPIAKPIRVGAGRRSFTLYKEGREIARRTVDVAAGDTTRVEFDVVDQPTKQIVRVEKSDGLPSSVLWTGVVTGALAAAAGTMTFVTLSKANEHRDLREGNKLVTASELKDVENDAKRYAWITDGLYAATLISATVTVVLFLADGDGDDEEPATADNALQVGVGPGAVTLSGSF